MPKSDGIVMHQVSSCGSVYRGGSNIRGPVLRGPYNKQDHISLWFVVIGGPQQKPMGPEVAKTEIIEPLHNP